MKKLLILFAFLTLAVQAKDINVPAGGNIVSAVNSASAGDVVRLAAGTYDHDDIALPVGVSLQGAGIDKTVLRPKNFTWWKASVLLYSATTTAGNQSISGITFDGNPQRAFAAIGIHNRTNVKIFDVKINRYYNSGIMVAGSPGNKAANIEIYNFLITESARESTAGSYGNIMFDGNAESVYVHDGEIQCLTNVNSDTYGNKTSGYPIKARPYYSGSDEFVGTVKNAKFHRLKLVTKSSSPWDNYRAPNISIEFWKSKGEEVEITECELNSHISLEYDYPNAPPVTFRVYKNKMRSNLQQFGEIAVDNVLIYDNDFYAEATPGNWAMFFNSNISGNSVKGIRITGNRFYLGGNSPNLYVSYNPLEDFIFADNKVFGTGRPTLLQLRTGSSAGSKNVQYTGNSFQSGYNELTFDMGASVRPTNFVVSSTSVVLPPVGTPPVIVTPPVVVNPPVVTPPVKKDTVYITVRDTVRITRIDTVIREVVKTVTKTDTIKVFLPSPYPVYYEPVFQYDSTRNEYVIKRKIKQ